MKKCKGLDGYAAFHRAVRELQEQGRLPSLTKLRSSKYLNNLIEQDHRNVKSRLGIMLGLKSFASAAITIRGVELMHRIRKEQFDLRALATQGQTTPESGQLSWQREFSLPHERIRASLIHSLHQSHCVHLSSNLSVLVRLLLADSGRSIQHTMLPMRKTRQLSRQTASDTVNPIRGNCSTNAT